MNTIFNCMRNFVLLLSLFLVSCSARIYPDADVRLLAYKSEIATATSDLETGRYCTKIYDYQRAEFFLLKSLNESDAIGYDDGRLYALNDFGSLNAERRKFPSAISNFNEALVLARKLKIPQAESDVLNNLAFVYIVSGIEKSPEPILTLLEQSGKLCKMAIKKLAIEQNTGLYYMSQKEYGKASASFLKVRKTAMKKDYFELLVQSTIHLGEIFLFKGQSAEGIDYFLKAFNIASSWDYKRGIIDAADQIFSYYEGIGDKEKALLYARAILNVRKGLQAKDFLETDQARVDRLGKR